MMILIILHYIDPSTHIPLLLLGVLLVSLVSYSVYPYYNNQFKYKDANQNFDYSDCKNTGLYSLYS